MVEQERKDKYSFEITNEELNLEMNDIKEEVKAQEAEIKPT